jgi:hypothetical protein
MQDSNSTDTGRISFIDNAKRFLQKTQEHVLQGINPGGIYQAIWCRDAAYILRDWFFIWQRSRDNTTDLSDMVSSNRT